MSLSHINISLSPLSLFPPPPSLPLSLKISGKNILIPWGRIKKKKENGREGGKEEREKKEKETPYNIYTKLMKQLKTEIKILTSGTKLGVKLS